MQTSEVHQDEQTRRWESYQRAHAAYDRAPSIENWLAKLAAHRAWAEVFVGGVPNGENPHN